MRCQKNAESNAISRVATPKAAPKSERKHQNRQPKTSYAGITREVFENTGRAYKLMTKINQISVESEGRTAMSKLSRASLVRDHGSNSMALPNDGRLPESRAPECPSPASRVDARGKRDLE